MPSIFQFSCLLFSVFPNHIPIWSVLQLGKWWVFCKTNGVWISHTDALDIILGLVWVGKLPSVIGKNHKSSIEILSVDSPHDSAALWQCLMFTSRKGTERCTTKITMNLFLPKPKVQVSDRCYNVFLVLLPSCAKSNLVKFLVSKEDERE